MEEMDYTRKFSLGDQRDLEIKAILSCCVSGPSGEGL